MAYATLVERTVPVARAKVFAALSDFGAVEKLLPGQIESCTLDGSGVGAVRRITVKGTPGQFVERLEAVYDGRLISYSMVAKSPLPLDLYHAVVTLADAPGGGCHIAWGSNWVPDGAPVDAIRGQLTALYNGFIDALAKLDG